MPTPAFEIDCFSKDSQDLYRAVIEQERIKKRLFELKEIDRQTVEHSLRVARIVAEFALSGIVDLESEQIEPVVCAAVLHDIGKVAVPKFILQKKTTLEENEWATIKHHPSTGFLKVSPDFDLYDILPILRHHSLQKDEYPSNDKQVTIINSFRDFGVSPNDLTSDDISNKTIMIAVADHLDARYPAQGEGIRSYSSRGHSIEELPEIVRTSFVSAGKIHELGKDKLLDDLASFSHTFLK